MERNHDIAAALEPDAAGHPLITQIFAASATLCGVCLTVIGLLQIRTAMRDLDTLADNLLAGNALLYMAVCLLSHLLLRYPAPTSRALLLARLVDAGFLVALVTTTAIGLFITWEILE